MESGRQDLLELRIKNGNSCTCVYVGRPRSMQKSALKVKILIQLLGFLEIKIWERETIHGWFKQLHSIFKYVLELTIVLDEVM